MSDYQEIVETILPTTFMTSFMLHLFFMGRIYDHVSRNHSSHLKKLNLSYSSSSILWFLGFKGLKGFQWFMFSLNRVTFNDSKLAKLKILHWICISIFTLSILIVVSTITLNIAPL